MVSREDKFLHNRFFDHSIHHRLFLLFSDGDEAAGIIRTVVRTARINGLDPEKYISYVLKQFSTKESSINARNNIQSLLPWSIKLPKELKGDLKKLPADLQKQLEAKD
ncbi:MAG: transposase domain-containing protein [Mollicutes bacterium]|nr:transposase domain-containing protein [Mollicutes bacterium]